MAVAPPKAKGVRGSDRAKVIEQAGGWTDAKTVGEFEEGHKLLYISHPYDLALLGKTMGHCSGTHFVWAWEHKIWYFFAIVDPKGVPVGTVHCKELKWMGKNHPLDKNVRYGYNDNAYGGYPAEVYKTKAWASRGGRYGGYINFDTVEAAFKEAGIEYEPGKYAPPNGFNSRTYEIPLNYQDKAGTRGFDSMFYCPIPARPAEISTELYSEFQRCWKAMKDEYDKNIGHFAIVGRKFKFDGKELFILSFSNKGQYDLNGKYRFWMRDWINAHQKHTKGELV